jgi:hypothetical protein
MLQAGRLLVRFQMGSLDFSIQLFLLAAPGSTQRVTEMSVRNLPGGKGQPARKADNLTDICEPIVQKMWEPRRLTTLWACYRDNFTFLYTFVKYPSISWSAAQYTYSVKVVKGNEM